MIVTGAKKSILERAAVCFLLVVITAVSPASAADSSPLARWAFDRRDDRFTVDAITRTKDQMEGNFGYSNGAVGDGLKCDGFTTSVIRKASSAPRLAGAFSVEAWLAIGAYPWNWCAIVAQNHDHRAGYSFGVDEKGHVGLQLAVDGQWKICTSEVKLPLMKWSHIAATFDPQRGIAVYVDGKESGRLPASGRMTPADDIDLRIARNHEDLPPAGLVRPQYALPASYSFDGIIDEVKIHGGCLGSTEVQRAFAAAQPEGGPDLKPERLPSGPKGPGMFGAFYCRLKYAKAWDALWRGQGPDVVVTFDTSPIRLVCWRGISYSPCWVTENGNWFNHEFMERGGGKTGAMGCCESMSDKQARYSHVKILESSDARAVIFWRYCPCDVQYRAPYTDRRTGWGDWAEEYYTVYPDGVAVRKVVMFSSNLKDWHEWCQSLPIMHPGQSPEDILDHKGVLSLANMAGRSRTYAWPPTGADPKSDVPGANIQVVHYKSQFQPFLILPPKGARIWLFDSERTEHSRFPWWNHWPVAQIASEGRYAVAADRPSHSCTSTQDCAPYLTTEHSMTKIVLCGLTDKTAAELLPLAKSWIQPAELKLSGNRFASQGYDRPERAYVVVSNDPGAPSILKFRLAATADAPLVNVALVVKDWGRKEVQLKIDGKQMQRGTDYGFGHRHSLTGSDLIVWIGINSVEPRDFSLEPVAQ